MTLTILIADDEVAARFGMRKALARADCEILEASDGNEALNTIRSRLPHLVFLDLNMPGKDGQAVLRELQSSPEPCQIVVVTANDAIEAAVECMRLGASDYITKPYEVEHLRAIVRSAAERHDLQAKVGRLQGALDGTRAFGALVGVSRPMRDLFRQMERVARAPVDILIRGETGTGKELLSRELHRLSDRSDGPFVAVNTAAIADGLVESELFGHVAGAFTGASADRKGLFEQAHGGTLFLDEVGDMPTAVQTKILRALEERTIQPVGSARSIDVNVRVVSATHQDLPQAIAEGHFRQDLYYRIRGVELAVPPLRSRREDIPLLAEYFLDRYASRGGCTAPRLAPEAVERLLAWDWPGNVRELEHVVTAAAALCSGDTIRPVDIEMPQVHEPPEPTEFEAYGGMPLTEGKARLVEAFERARIRRALQDHDGNVTAAARSLGIHRQSLQQKLHQLGMDRGSSRDDR